jgi:hypothetical protein
MEQDGLVKRHRQQVLDLAGEYRSLDEQRHRTRHGLAVKLALEIEAHGLMVQEASRATGNIEGLALAWTFQSLAAEASRQAGFGMDEALFTPWLDTVERHLEVEPLLLGAGSVRTSPVEVPAAVFAVAS